MYRAKYLYTRETREFETLWEVFKWVYGKDSYRSIGTYWYLISPKNKVFTETPSLDNGVFYVTDDYGVLTKDYLNPRYEEYCNYLYNNRKTFWKRPKFKYRDGPVEGIHNRSWHRSHLRHGANLRGDTYNMDDEDTYVEDRRTKNILRNIYDRDRFYYRKRQKNWKKFRKTQYKGASAPFFFQMTLDISFIN